MSDGLLRTCWRWWWSGRGPPSAQPSLPELSLEELMRIDAGRVFGASERLQPVTEAPASVSFITAEEIARYGYRTLADFARHTVLGSRWTASAKLTRPLPGRQSLAVGAEIIDNIHQDLHLQCSDVQVGGCSANHSSLQEADPASDQHRQDTIVQNGRTPRIGLRGKLWDKR